MIHSVIISRKLKLYYSIVWPIILWTVAVTSITIIMISYSYIVVSNKFFSTINLEYNDI